MTCFFPSFWNIFYSLCIFQSLLSFYFLLQLPTLKSDVKLEGGSIKQFSHWSNTCQCEMTFSIFLPQRSERLASDPPVLYYLSGLTCTDENARTKAHFAQEAARVGLAVVFPDTSPRGTDIKGYIFTHQIFPLGGSKKRPGDLDTGSSIWINANQWRPCSLHQILFNLGICFTFFKRSLLMFQIARLEYRIHPYGAPCRNKGFAGLLLWDLEGRF